MILTEEQILGIKHGIEEGFKYKGIEIGRKEQIIIDLSVRTAIETVQEFMKTK